MSKMISSSKQFMNDILGIDVGGARIGVARIHPIVKLSEPLAPIIVKTDDPFEAIADRIIEHSADAVVFGLPRSLQGEETEQTRTVQEFVRDFVASVNPKIPLYFIDEAGTSKAADDRIGNKSDISRDSMSACIMLEDFVELRDIAPLIISERRN